MNTGEKIKYYRNLRGISQEMLAKLSGIGVSTIKKYELNIRNPKPEQILKISNALGISIYLFMDFDLETVSDIMSLLIKMDEQTNMNFEGEKDAEGFYIPSSIKISFTHPDINSRLSQYMRARDLENGLNNEMKDYKGDIAAEKSAKRSKALLEQIKLSVADSSMIVKKESKGLAVKIYPIE